MKLDKKTAELGAEYLREHARRLGAGMGDGIRKHIDALEQCAEYLERPDAVIITNMQLVKAISDSWGKTVEGDDYIDHDILWARLS
jgi:hypothetical protein